MGRILEWTGHGRNNDGLWLFFDGTDGDSRSIGTNIVKMAIPASKTCRLRVIVGPRTSRHADSIGLRLEIDLSGCSTAHMTANVGPLVRANLAARLGQR